jgi:Microtubule binding
MIVLCCMLQTLKGNIRVMCRVRPCAHDERTIVTSPLEGLLLVSPLDKRAAEFEFDHVFGPESTQVSFEFDHVFGLEFLRVSSLV